MDAWEESLLAQHQLDADQTADQSYQAATEAVAGSPLDPEASRKIREDVKAGVPEGLASIPGAPFRFIRGLLNEAGSAWRSGIVRRASPVLYDTIGAVAEGASPMVPAWVRGLHEDFSSGLDEMADLGKDSKTVTGRLIEGAANLGINMAVLSSLGVLRGPAAVSKGATYLQSLVPAMKEAGRWGALQFVLSGDSQGLAKETRDSYLEYLKDNPHLHELFSAVMTSKDPDSDALIAHAVSGLEMAGLTFGLSAALPSFRLLRRTLGRAMSPEEAAKEFALKIREVPGGTLREVAPGGAEEMGIGKSRAYSGGVEGVKVPPPKIPRTPAPPPSLSEQIAAEHAAQGGSSFTQAGENLSGKPGYAVGGSKSFEHVQKTPFTPAELDAYKARPDVAAELKANPDAYVGTWFNEVQGEHYADVSTKVGTLEEAMDLARKNKQQSIHDLQQNQTLPVELVNTSMIGGGQSGWVTPDGKTHLNGRASHDDTARMLTKQYGLNPDAPAESLLGKGGVRWSTERGYTMNIEINQDPKSYAAARKVIMAAPDSTQTWVLDLSSSKVNKHGMRGSSEYFYAETADDAIAKLDYFEKNGELPGRSKAAKFRGGQGPVHDLTGVSGEPQDFINQLEQWKVKAEERLRKKGNRLSMTAGIPDPESVKDMAVIGAAMIARGVKKTDAIRTALLSRYGETVKGNLDKVVSLSQEYYKTQLLDLAPSFHKQFDRAFSLAAKGADTAEWYDGVPQVLKSLGDKNDQKMFVAMYAALSPLMDRAINVDQALAVFAKWKPQRDMGVDGLLRILVEGGFGKSGQESIAKHMQQAWQAIESGKDTAFEDIFQVKLPNSSKINSFFRNIWHRIERPDEVTIDTKMYRVFGLPEETLPKSKTYSILREVMRQEAEVRGENPSQLQAKIWIAADKEVESVRLSEAGRGHHPGMGVGEVRDDRLLREIIKEKIDNLLGGKKAAKAPPVEPQDLMKSMVDKVLRMQKGKGA